MDKKIKNIVCFGADSFLAQAFHSAYQQDYNILQIYRSEGKGHYLDFEIEKDAQRLSFEFCDYSIDGIIFFQGINPSVGLEEMTTEHFSKMLKINLIMPTIIIKDLRAKLNIGCSVIFLSSVSKRKGSYDPSYAAAKSAIRGLIHSLSNACPDFRFNELSLGLVEGSPVHKKMTQDFIDKHKEKMFQGKLINKNDVVRMINELILNESINRSDIPIERGYL